MVLRFKLQCGKVHIVRKTHYSLVLRAILNLKKKKEKGVCKGLQAVRFELCRMLATPCKPSPYETKVIKHQRSSYRKKYRKTWKNNVILHPQKRLRVTHRNHESSPAVVSTRQETGFNLHNLHVCHSAQTVKQLVRKTIGNQSVSLLLCSGSVPRS